MTTQAPAERLRTDTILCWSGGKDSAMALKALQDDPAHRVSALVTTVTRDFDRISMHGVRRTLLRQQAAALALPLKEVMISRGADNAEYDARMGEALTSYRAEGIETCAYGDLFLADIRAYREQQLATLGMKGVWPLWGLDTTKLMRQFISDGYKAVVVCLDPNRLSPGFAGRLIDEAFLSALPRNVDPCGENGEFHTFVFDGPIFRTPVKLAVGESVMRDGFCFCDLSAVD